MIAKIPMAEAPNIQKTTFFRKVKRVLGLDLHSWEQLMLFSLGIAGLIAVAVFITTASVVILQRHETAEAKRELDEYKLTVESKVADAKKEGIEAGRTAGNALLRAAELEKEAEAAKLQTEQLKQVVAWRTISPETAQALVKSLGARPGSVNLRYMDGDPEALFLAIQISQILEKAKWKMAPGAIKPAGTIIFGLALPDSNGEDALTLRQSFSAVHLAFSSNAIPTDGVSFNISEIAGAPTLVVGSKAPPQLP